MAFSLFGLICYFRVAILPIKTSIKRTDYGVFINHDGEKSVKDYSREYL